MEAHAGIHPIGALTPPQPLAITDAVLRRVHQQGLNPFGIAMRESRDSDLNPASTAIIVGLDVTGSMGMIADALRARPRMMVEEILARKPVSDPTFCALASAMCCTTGAATSNPVEADIRIAGN